MSEAFVVGRPNGAALRALNYTPEVERLRSRTGAGATSLGSLITEIGPAYGSVFVRVDCEPEHGVELITQGDMFAAEPEGRVIRRDSMARPERHVVRRWQVLIAGAGTLGETELYGRAIISDSRLEGRYVGPHAMVLTFCEPTSDQSLFTYAYLLTRMGLRAIRASSYGTKILGLRKDLLSELPVPIPTSDVGTRVAALVRRCVENRELHLSELQSARRIFEELPEVREAHELCSGRHRRAIHWSDPLSTLCAWNYASTGGALERLRRSWPGSIGDTVDIDGIHDKPRFERHHCTAPYGVNLISQRDVFLVRQIPQRIRRPEYADEKLFCPAGTILLAAQGSDGEGNLFGKAAVVTPDWEGSVFSEHLMRIPPRPGLAFRLFAWLSTRVGFRLIRTTAVGTMQRSMRTDLLLRLPVPDLASDRFMKVEEHVRMALNARIEAAKAEKEAIRIVEEEVLPKWLA